MSVAGQLPTACPWRNEVDTFALVPIVDISEAPAIAAALVKHACSTVGFFYVAGHGVPASLIADEFKVNKQLFALPIEEKLRMLADVNNRGYTPFAEEVLDPANQSEGDTKEGFYFGREVAADSDEGRLPLHGPNQWPPEALLPGFKQTTVMYFETLRQLGMRLLRLLALALELPEEFFEPMFNPPMMFLRPLHYSAQVSHPDDGIYGAGAHSDYGMLTILATDEVPGLQIWTGNEWKDVNPVPGTFIINLGDMLERWTNGKFKSTRHRVVNMTGRERYSIPFFFEPNFNTLVECLPQCCRENPPQYPPVTAGQHLLDKYAQTHAGYKGPTQADGEKAAN